MTSQTLQRKNRRNANMNSVETKLKEELERLKHLYNAGYELHSIKWIPNECCEKEGEVKDGIIYIYSNESKSLKTLRHEFFHYLISKPAKKYEKIINTQGSLIRLLLAQLLDEAYKEEEFMVERLVDALEQMDERANS